MMPTLGMAGEILASMITPAVLISASGTLVLSTTNRLGRVVDRVRGIQTIAEGMQPDEDPDHKRLITQQLGFLTRRIRLLQTTVTSLYAAIGLLVGTSVAIGIAGASGQVWIEWLPVFLGILGATAMFAASLMLVREARLAVRTTLHELAYIRKVVTKRTGHCDEGTA